MYTAPAAYAMGPVAHSHILTNGTIHVCQPDLQLFSNVALVSFYTAISQLNACQMDIGVRQIYQRKCFAKLV